jgi:regulatory protein
VPAPNQSKDLSVSRETIENKALQYLERFDASAAKLRKILEEFVKQRAKAQGVDSRPFLDIAHELVKRYESNGLIDDRRYASSMAQSLIARGVSRQVAKSKLLSRGITSEVIDEVISRLASEGGSELAAARALVRKRKLGCFRPEHERRDAARRDLGVLARAGFDFQTAKAALALEGVDEDDTF